MPGHAGVRTLAGEHGLADVPDGRRLRGWRGGRVDGLAVQDADEGHRAVRHGDDGHRVPLRVEAARRPRAHMA